MNIESTQPQGVSLSVHGLRKSYNGTEVLKVISKYGIRNPFS